jgi:hypothetical protein
MRDQSICLPLLSDPCDWRRRRHQNVPNDARRGYARGAITADVFNRFNILTIRGKESVGLRLTTKDI